MSASVHIWGYGARTPLGMAAQPSAAACRAGIAAIRAHPFFVDASGESLRGAFDPLLDPALVGPQRLLALAETALREGCEPLVGVTGVGGSVPLFLALPEPRPGFGADEVQALRAGLAQLRQLPLPLGEIAATAQGHAAGFAMLALACDRIRRGEIALALVGGVDSYFCPETIEWLDSNRQIVSARARSAFVPGEGAGFCLLAGDVLTQRRGAASMGRLRCVALAREQHLIKTNDLCLGVGLTAVVDDAMSRLANEERRVQSIFCDINGERYRAEEWSYVCLRLPQYFDDPTAYRSPADSWGDMGAASAPLFAMLASQAALRGYAAGARSLLWASSEGGLRGAAVLETSGPR